MRFPTTPNSLFSAQAKEDANAYPYIRSFTFYCNSKLRPSEKCAVPKINVSYRYCFCLYFLFMLLYTITIYYYYIYYVTFLFMLLFMLYITVDIFQ